MPWVLSLQSLCAELEANFYACVVETVGANLRKAIKMIRKPKRL